MVFITLLTPLILRLRSEHALRWESLQQPYLDYFAERQKVETRNDKEDTLRRQKDNIIANESVVIPKPHHRDCRVTYGSSQ